MINYFFSDNISKRRLSSIVNCMSQSLSALRYSKVHILFYIFYGFIDHLYIILIFKKTTVKFQRAFNLLKCVNFDINFKYRMVRPITRIYFTTSYHVRKRT